MNKTRKNGFVCYATTLHVSTSAYCYAGQHGTFRNLLSILSGQPVDATIYSPTNVVGHTTEKQIREAYAALDKEHYWWITSSALEAVVLKFGDGILGFDMSGARMVETPQWVKERIAEVENADCSTDESNG